MSHTDVYKVILSCELLPVKGTQQSATALTKDNKTSCG